MSIAGGEIELALLRATVQGTLPASLRALCSPRLPGCVPGRCHTPALVPRRRVVDLHERVRTQPYNTDPNPSPGPGAAHIARARGHLQRREATSLAPRVRASGWDSGPRGVLERTLGEHPHVLGARVISRSGVVGCLYTLCSGIQKITGGLGSLSI